MSFLYLTRLINCRLSKSPYFSWLVMPTSSLARSLRDLMHWSSLRSFLRTYERPTCIKSILTVISFRLPSCGILLSPLPFNWSLFLARWSWGRHKLLRQKPEQMLTWKPRLLMLRRSMYYAQFSWQVWCDCFPLLTDRMRMIFRLGQWKNPKLSASRLEWILTTVGAMECLSTTAVGKLSWIFVCFA